MRGWIIGTLSEDALGIVIGLDTLAQVWKSLKEVYTQSFQERQFQLTQQLNHMKKYPKMFLNDYLRKFKGVCDGLFAIGFHIDDKTKVFSLLNGLWARYEPFTTSMLKSSMPSYAKAVPLLQSYETCISLHSFDATTYTAFHGQRNNSKFNNKGSHQSSNFSYKGKGFSPTNQAIVKQNNQETSTGPNNNFTRESRSGLHCQICDKRGHTIIRC